MKKLLLIALFSCSFFVARSQSFYICDVSYTTSDIRRITYSGGAYTSTTIDRNGIRDSFYSIAIQGNTLYYITTSTELIKADIIGDKLINREIILPFGAFGNSLSIAKNGTIYWVNFNTLYKYEQQLQRVSTLGNLPYTASGDLMFYKDDLYMASGSGIVKIDLNNLSLSNYYISTPSGSSIYGLASFPVGPKQNKYIALSAVNGGTDLVELDMENKALLNILSTIPFNVYDAASEVEDGTFIAIEINKISQFADCNHPGKAIVKVVTKPHSAPYTYELNGSVSNSTGTFTGLTPGIYDLKITSPYETIAQSFSVSIPPAVKPANMVTKQGPMCDALGQIRLDIAANGAVYKIKYANNTETLNSKLLTGLATGTYHFEILNEVDCPVDNFDVKLDREKCTIKYDKLVIEPECNVINKSSVKVLTNAHTDPYNYTLNGITNTTGIFNLLDPGTYTIKIRSAEDEKDVIAVVPDLSLSKPKTTYTITNPVCDVAGQVKFSIDGTGAYTVRYKGTAIPANNIMTGLAPGTHHFTVHNNLGCIVDEFDVVLGRDKCTIKYNRLQLNQDCNTIRRGSIRVITDPHADLYSYTLDNKTTNLTGSFEALVTGPHSIKITSSEDEREVAFTVPDHSVSDPVITTTKTEPYCAVKGEVKFTLPVSTTGYQVKYDGVVYPFSKAFNYLEPGKHQFVILKPTGCVLDSISVDLIYQPCVINIKSTSSVQECDVLGKGVIQVTGDDIPEEYTYYLNGSNANHTGRFGMLAPGSYTVKVTASGGNTPKEMTLTVPDYDLTRPKYSVVTVNPLCDLLGSIRLQVTADPALYQIAYEGSTYPFDHNFKDLIAGSYYFKILKRDGCVANEFTIKLVQESCNPVIFPNAFTPNGDGMNDVFRPSQDSRATQYQLSIFNRQGSLLFMSKDLRNGWDGQNQGKPMPVGTYYWMSTYTDNNGKRASQQGHVTLLK